MFGYYLASIGIFHFYYKGQLTFVEPLEAWYTAVFAEAGGTFDPVTGLEIKPSCQDLVDAVASSSASSFHNFIAQWAMDYFCNDATTEWRLIIVIYHGMWLIGTVVVLATLGLNVLTFCD